MHTQHPRPGRMCQRAAPRPPAARRRTVSERSCRAPSPAAQPARPRRATLAAGEQQAEKPGTRAPRRVPAPRAPRRRGAPTARMRAPPRRPGSAATARHAQARHFCRSVVSWSAARSTTLRARAHCRPLVGPGAAAGGRGAVQRAAAQGKMRYEARRNKAARAAPSGAASHAPARPGHLRHPSMKGASSWALLMPRSQQHTRACQPAVAPARPAETLASLLCSAPPSPSPPQARTRAGAGGSSGLQGRRRCGGGGAPHAAPAVELADLRAQRVQVALDDVRQEGSARGVRGRPISVRPRPADAAPAGYLVVQAVGAAVRADAQRSCAGHRKCGSGLERCSRQQLWRQGRLHPLAIACCMLPGGAGRRRQTDRAARSTHGGRPSTLLPLAHRPHRGARARRWRAAAGS